MIEDFILKCKTDPIFAGTMATLRHTEVANLQLTDEEMDGEEVIGDELPYNIIHGRMLHDNTPKLSVVIEPKMGANILDRLNEMLPNELIPNDCDTPESVLQKNHDCLWLDEVWRHGKAIPSNGDKTIHYTDLASIQNELVRAFPVIIKGQINQAKSQNSSFCIQGPVQTTQRNR
jgi:hypothetical protein